MSDAPEHVVRYDVRGCVAWVTIDRPERRNALTPGVIAGLHAGIERASHDATVRAIVLTGAGERAFCAGADLRMLGDEVPAPQPAPRTAYAELLRALLGCSLPLVARVNGDCLAGGMGLLAACDLAIASEPARFGLPEVKVGLFPFQVLAVLRALVGARRLAEMTLTGELLSAADAYEAGLLNGVVPPQGLDAAVDALLVRLTGPSPAAQRRGKLALRAIEGQSALAALPFLEAQFDVLVRMPDAAEGARAFVERRPPRWSEP